MVLDLPDKHDPSDLLYRIGQSNTRVDSMRFSPIQQSLISRLVRFNTPLNRMEYQVYWLFRLQIFFFFLKEKEISEVFLHELAKD